MYVTYDHHDFHDNHYPTVTTYHESVNDKNRLSKLESTVAAPKKNRPKLITPKPELSTKRY